MGSEMCIRDRPWSVARFRQLERRLPPGAYLVMEATGERVVGADLEAQAERLQAREGASHSWIGPLSLQV